MSDFESAVSFVLRNEGGFDDNPNDRGGATKYGISLRFLKSIPIEKLKKYGVFVDSTINSRDIQQLTLDQAKAIYRAEFWDNRNFEQLTSQDVCNYIFDMAINMGISPAIKCAQRACWALFRKKDIIVDDGILGPQTIKLINDSGIFILPVMRSERAADYKIITIKNPPSNQFINGWLNRAYNC
jgi:lysozyme family protein